jgi:lysophospholipase L1-like esterase
MISRFHDKDTTLTLDNFDKKMVEDYQKITLSEIYKLLTDTLKQEPLGADGMHCNALVHTRLAKTIEPELVKIVNNIS